MRSDLSLRGTRASTFHDQWRGGGCGPRALVARGAGVRRARGGDVLTPRRARCAGGGSPNEAFASAGGARKLYQRWGCSGGGRSGTRQMPGVPGRYGPGNSYACTHGPPSAWGGSSGDRTTPGDVSVGCLHADSAGRRLDAFQCTKEIGGGRRDGPSLRSCAALFPGGWGRGGGGFDISGFGRWRAQVTDREKASPTGRPVARAAGSWNRECGGQADPGPGSGGCSRLRWPGLALRGGRLARRTATSAGGRDDDRFRRRVGGLPRGDGTRDSEEDVEQRGGLEGGTG